MKKNIHKSTDFLLKSVFNRQFHTSINNNYPVTIRVWPKSDQSVGHVSLETNKYYISLWPQDGAGKPKIKWYSYEGALKSSLEEDLTANGTIDGDGNITDKDPNPEIILNMLDEEAINNEFDKFKSSDELKWVLIGNNKLFLKDGVHSCASLAAHLLKVGGIEKTLSKLPLDVLNKEEYSAFDKFVHDKIISTPFNVEMVAKMAQRAENIITKENVINHNGDRKNSSKTIDEVSIEGVDSIVNRKP
jgi:hypothetical protein